MKRIHRQRLVRLLALALVFLPLAACGSGGGGSGIVSQLTGDSDAEVASSLQNQVFRALQRTETDDPIDD